MTMRLMLITLIHIYFTMLINLTHSADENATNTNVFEENTSFRECLKWKLHRDHDYIIVNGSLIYLHRNLSYSIGDYTVCGDTAYVCIPDEAQPPWYYIDLIYIVSWTLSIVALVTSLVFHWTLPSGSHTHDPRPLLYHMISLLTFYILEITFQAGPEYSTPVCYFLAIWGQYSLRAAFTWLNVVTFDMWRTFHPRRILKIPQRASCCKFFWQSVYAWSVPALIIIASNLLVYAPVPAAPGYNERCLVTMYGNEAQVIFFYASSSLTLLVNVVFFVLTVINLRSLSKDVAAVNHRIHSQMVRMYLKLLAVTGVFWILEVIEWAVIPFAPQPIIWIVPDVLSALQGVFLFLIYNCSSTVRNQIKQQIVSKIRQVRSQQSISSDVTQITTF